MTPKEKAQELIEKFADYPLSYMENKQCALIAVDEMIEATTDAWSHSPYWQQVRTEIESL